MAIKDQGKSASLEDENLKSQGIDLNFMGSPEETAESRTVASRKRIHEQVDADISKFLAKGGRISRVDSTVTGDPPRRPNYRYGQRPI
ncbi:MAG: hypothetical protein ACI92E_000014 [Oceanicoccus sp.]|jgi:hypothetical protein